MLCEKCKKNEAVVFYKETVNGKTKSMALCEKCAREAEDAGEIKGMSGGFFEDTFAGVNSIFGSLFGLPQYHQKAIGETKKSTLCGATFDDLVREGKAGCPECYKTFSDELSGTIAKIHGTTSHTGNAPARFRAGREKKRQIASLEAELKEAVASEEYEKAAELRDRLKELKSDAEKDGE